jgi:DNA repair protein RadC
MVKEKKITGIKSWPEDDRPREKLLKRGAGALSNSELLAILLRTGTTGTSAIDLARKILKKFSTFRNMAHTDARDWKEFKGLGGAKIAHIQAALEIGRRYREGVVDAITLLQGVWRGLRFVSGRSCLRSESS